MKRRYFSSTSQTHSPAWSKFVSASIFFNSKKSYVIYLFCQNKQVFEKSVWSSREIIRLKRRNFWTIILKHLPAWPQIASSSFVFNSEIFDVINFLIHVDFKIWFCQILIFILPVLVTYTMHCLFIQVIERTSTENQKKSSALARVRFRANTDLY